MRALAHHLQLGDPAVVGYSLGAVTAALLLDYPAFRVVALCGTGSFHVEGEPGSERPAELDDVLATCFLDGKWDDHPEAKPYRAFARLDDDADFLALGAAARVIRPVPKAALVSPKMPVLVLNGGGDLGAADGHDLARLIPGARRAVDGDTDHGTAPSDLLFQRELTRFLLEVCPSSVCDRGARSTQVCNRTQWSGSQESRVDREQLVVAEPRMSDIALTFPDGKSERRLLAHPMAGDPRR